MWKTCSNCHTSIYLYMQLFTIPTHIQYLLMSFIHFFPSLAYCLSNISVDSIQQILDGFEKPSSCIHLTSSTTPAMKTSRNFCKRQVILDSNNKHTRSTILASKQSVENSVNAMSSWIQTKSSTHDQLKSMTVCRKFYKCQAWYVNSALYKSLQGTRWSHVKIPI